jgi:hypothetical protein
MRFLYLHSYLQNTRPLCTMNFHPSLSRPSIHLSVLFSAMCNATYTSYSSFGRPRVRFSAQRPTIMPESFRYFPHIKIGWRHFFPQSSEFIFHDHPPIRYQAYITYLGRQCWINEGKNNRAQKSHASPFSKQMIEVLERSSLQLLSSYSTLNPLL